MILCEERLRCEHINAPIHEKIAFYALARTGNYRYAIFSLVPGVDTLHEP